jgi:antirestriction protein ArdC
LPNSIHGLYRGMNLWHLWVQQIEKGWQSNQWLTFLQVKQQNGHVLKGAKGTTVCFWKLRDIEIDDHVEPSTKTVPVFKQYTVFNLDQTSLAEQSSLTNDQSHDLQHLLDLLNVHVSVFGNQPHYNPTQDVIVMPQRDSFSETSHHDTTLLHELIHWSGAGKRLNRICAKEYSKSDAARAEEELVAELGSVFLSQYFGITGDLTNHASYVASWKKHLDAKAIARSVTQAARAFHWLTDHLQATEAAEQPIIENLADQGNDKASLMVS